MSGVLRDLERLEASLLDEADGRDPSDFDFYDLLDAVALAVAHARDAGDLNGTRPVTLLRRVVIFAMSVECAIAHRPEDVWWRFEMLERSVRDAGAVVAEHKVRP